VAQQAIPGTIGFDAPFTVYVPAGTAAQAVAQAQQVLATDQATAAADQTELGDTESANAQSARQAQGALQAARASATADQSQAQQDHARLAADQQALNAATAKQGGDQAQSIVDEGSQRAEQQDQLADQQLLAADQQQLADVQAATPPDATAIAADRAAVTVVQQRLNAEATSLLHDGFTAADDQAALQQDGSDVASCRATVATDESKAQADATRTALSDPAAVNGAEAAAGVAQAAADRALHQAQAKVAADGIAVEEAQASLATASRTQTGAGATFTLLPAVGVVITEGQPVYALDAVPVPLLYGQVPLFRELTVGVADGPDVAELNADLGMPFTPHFGPATVTALQRWQGAHGLPATGALALGQVVVGPGPLRVAAVHAALGATVGTGAVLDATSPVLVVTAQVPLNDLGSVAPGDAVTIDLPDGRTGVPGRVRDVGASVASQSSGNGTAPSTSAPSTVTFSDPTLARGLDQASVLVHVTTRSVHGVLAVPIEALLALSGGGEGVEVVSGGGRRIVPVTTGLFTGTEVEVDGNGIAAGTQVVVPAP